MPLGMVLFMLISCGFLIFFCLMPARSQIGNAHANPNGYPDSFACGLLRGAFHVIQEFENKVG
jgi:hypothetical protein